MKKLTDTNVVHEIVLLCEVETDGGVDLEPGDVGTILERDGDNYLVQFKFDSEELEGGYELDTARISVDSFAIIGIS